MAGLFDIFKGGSGITGSTGAFRGLSMLKTNPYEERAKTTAAMMQNSGYAKPLLALMMGRDTRLADEYRQKQETTLMDLYQKQQQKEHAWKVLELTAKISDDDPEAANDILEVEARENPFLQDIAQNVKFAGKGKGIYKLMTNPKTGEVFWFNWERAKRQLAALGENASVEDIKRILEENKFVISEAMSQAPKAPKTRERKAGDKIITEEWDANTGTWKTVSTAPRKLPSEGAGGAGSGGSKFNKYLSKYLDLKKKIASFKSGINPLTGTEWNTKNIQGALQVLEPEIERLERYLKSRFPDEWNAYVGYNTSAPVDTVASHGESLRDQEERMYNQAIGYQTGDWKRWLRR